MVEPKAMMALFLKPSSTSKFLLCRVFQLMERKVEGIRDTPLWICWELRVALTIISQKGSRLSALSAIQST